MNIDIYAYIMQTTIYLIRMKLKNYYQFILFSDNHGILNTTL